MHLRSAQQPLGLLEPVLKLCIALPSVLQVHRQLCHLGPFILQLIPPLALLSQRLLGIFHRSCSRFFQNVELLRLLLALGQLLLQRASRLLHLLLELARTFQFLGDAFLQVPSQACVVCQLRAALCCTGLFSAELFRCFLKLRLQRGSLDAQRVVGRLLGLQLLVERCHFALQVCEGGCLFLAGLDRFGQLLLQLVDCLC